jgi:hypothetical protein
MWECLVVAEAPVNSAGAIPLATRGATLCRRCKMWLLTKRELRAVRRLREQAGEVDDLGYLLANTVSL